MSSSVRLNLAVIAHGDDPQNPEHGYYTMPVDAETPEGANREIGLVGDGETVVEVHKVVLKDEEHEHLATTFESLEGLNGLSDEPRVTDLLMRFFTLGYEARKRIEGRQGVAMV